MALDREQSAREKEEAAVMAKNEQLRVNLLRTISHDLRTPLTSILGNADSLISNFDALDEGMRKQIFSDIYEDAGWLIELVENLLALTKIEDGSVKLQLSDQVVEDVVREALRHVERRKNEHEITVDCGEDSTARPHGCKADCTGTGKPDQQCSKIYTGRIQDPDYSRKRRKKRMDCGGR